LEILAFPCNQFAEQEPESNDKIVDFVCTRFKSEFPIFDKVGPHALTIILKHPTRQIKKLLFLSSVFRLVAKDLLLNL